MASFFKRALPFSLTLILGLVFATVVSHRSSNTEHTRKTGPRSPEEVTLQIVHLQYSGSTYRSTVTTSRIDGERPPNEPSLKEVILWAQTPGACETVSCTRVIAYATPDSVDGELVTGDAVILSAPRPGFWQDQKFYQDTSCTAVLLRVTLGSSGQVSNVEQVPPVKCSGEHLAEVVAAAKQISFLAALQNYRPVSQRISILYRTF